MKRKGTRAERELLDLFWNKGFVGVRVAGSGSFYHSSLDLLVGNKEKKYAIECKVLSKETLYIDSNQMESLKEFANKFGAIPLIAIKILREGWFFLEPNFFEKTKNGNYKINKENILKWGKNIEEIVGKYEQKRLF